MTVAALAMYPQPARVGAAYQSLLTEVAERLEVRLAPAPADPLALWTHPELLLAQTCGYPWALRLRDQVRLVGAPRYRLAGCEGAEHCAFILAAETGKAHDLADFRGRRVALNALDSNTGMNLLRLALAPLAEHGRFFGEVIVSESHVNSLRLLQEGEADLAAVDAVTYGYLARDEPERVAGLRLVQRTRFSPTLPFITAATRSEAEMEALRSALTASLTTDAERAAILALEGIVPVSAQTYQPLLEWRRLAADQGYPVIA